MVPVENEQNIEVLRHYTLWLQSQVKELATENQELKNAKELSKQNWLDDKLRDQLSRLQQKFYTHGRESLTPREDRPVGHEEEQLKLHSERPQEGKEVTAEGFKPNGPVFYTYKMSERELKNESIARGIEAGHEAWEEVKNLYQKSFEVTVFERIYQEVLHQQCKYKLKAKYNKTDKEVLVTAPGPAKLRPGSRYSIDFAVSVITDKYEYHIPLERQRRKMQAQGLEVDVKTLYGLCEAVAEHCDFVRERIRKNILSDFCAVHLDESTWPIVGSDSQSYMWVLSNRIGSYYQFEPTRSGKIADELLKDYQGSVLTDGYGGYNRVRKSEGLRLGRCWSHARREFFERRKDYPTAENAVRFIDQLFKIEAEAKTFEELKELRKTKSRETIKALYAWMLETTPKYLPSSGVRQAISYCNKYWSELTAFLDDLTLPLSNNDAERAMRHIVMGRKNFSGSKTINGADTAASIYTVIESCKRVGLQPSQYLKYLIDGRWFKDEIKTPYEFAMAKLGPNKRISFPQKSEWRVNPARA